MRRDDFEVFLILLLIPLALFLAVVIGSCALSHTSKAGMNAVTIDAMRANGMSVTVAQDGPMYDLPDGYSSFYCHDRHNRMWIVIRDDGGSIAVIPALDARGEQIVTPQA